MNDRQADPADLATAQEELARQVGMASRRREGPAVSRGRCLECDVEVAQGVRWCCAACRDEWLDRNPRFK